MREGKAMSKGRVFPSAMVVRPEAKGGMCLVWSKTSKEAWGPPQQGRGSGGEARRVRRGQVRKGPVA